MKRAALLFLAPFLSACITPSSGNVFEVACYNGGVIVWSSNRVTSYVASNTGAFDFTVEHAKHDVHVHADCVITEVSAK